MAVKQKTMPPRIGLPLWGWTVGAVLIIAVVFLGYRTWQTEQYLESLRNKLVSAKQEAADARSDAAELERVGELKLKAAERELERLNKAVAQAEAEASKREVQIAMLRQGVASCDEVFEAWDEVKASPPSILAIFRITREAAAAKDCLEKDDIATACKHWQGLLVEIARMGPPLSESRSEIKELMRQNRCEARPSSQR
jgi:uncharacterized coiled-coil protein SlyX